MELYLCVGNTRTFPLLPPMNSLPADLIDSLPSVDVQPPPVDMQTPASADAQTKQPPDPVLSKDFPTSLVYTILDDILGFDPENCLGEITKALDNLKLVDDWARFQHAMLSRIRDQLALLVKDEQKFEDLLYFWHGMCKFVSKVDVCSYLSTTQDELAALLAAQKVPLLAFLMNLPSFLRLGVRYEIRILIRGRGGIFARTSLETCDDSNSDLDDEDVSKYPCQEQELPDLDREGNYWCVEGINKIDHVIEFVDNFCEIPDAGIKALMDKKIMVEKERRYNNYY
jgi:hypothetical protein